MLVTTKTQRPGSGCGLRSVAEMMPVTVQQHSENTSVSAAEHNIMGRKKRFWGQAEATAQASRGGEVEAGMGRGRAGGGSVAVGPEPEGRGNYYG